MRCVILIDAKNLVYRVAWTHRMLQASDGRPTSVLYGAVQAMLTVARKFPGAALAWVWDGQGRTWRHDLLDGYAQPRAEKKEVTTQNLAPYLKMSLDYIQKTFPGQSKLVRKNEDPRVVVGYKANRPDRTESDEGRRVLEQIPTLREFLDRIGIRQFEIPQLEADDLIGILNRVARKLVDRVLIYSSDRDFYQFIDDRTGVLKSGLELAEPEEIRREFGIGPEEYTKLRAIIGDSTDNIPHLFQKVGPKTAARWIQAGLDPSLPNWTDHSRGLRVGRLEAVGVNKFGVGERWAEVHTNYRCCRIVEDWKDRELPVTLQGKLRRVCEMEVDDFYVDKLQRTEANYRWLVEYCAGYELARLYESRQELWELP